MTVGRAAAAGGVSFMESSQPAGSVGAWTRCSATSATRCAPGGARRADRRGDRRAGARHRRQHRDLLDRRRRPAAAPTLPEPRAAGDGVAGHARARRTAARLDLARTVRRMAAARERMFEHLAAVRGWSPNLTGVDEPERLRGAAVSAAVLRGARRAARGGPRLHRRGRSARRRPGRRSSATRCGRGSSIAIPAWSDGPILLDGQATTIVGIMPAGFQPPIVGADIWSPIRIDPSRAPRGIIVLRVLGEAEAGRRRGAGAGGHGGARDAARSRKTASGSGRASRSFRSTTTSSATSARCCSSSRSRSALVLCIACANVMSLLLARAADRGA